MSIFRKNDTLLSIEAKKKLMDIMYSVDEKDGTERDDIYLRSKELFKNITTNDRENTVRVVDLFLTCENGGNSELVNNNSSPGLSSKNIIPWSLVLLRKTEDLVKNLVEYQETGKNAELKIEKTRRSADAEGKNDEKVFVEITWDKIRVMEFADSFKSPFFLFSFASIGKTKYIKYNFDNEGNKIGQTIGNVRTDDGSTKVIE